MRLSTTMSNGVVVVPCSLKPRTWKRPGSERPWITWCTARGYPWKAKTTSRSLVKIVVEQACR